MQWSEWKAKLQERSERIVRDCSDLAKRAMKRTSSYIQGHKKQTVSIAAGLLVTVAAGASAQYYYTSNVTSVYHVIVNGQEIGVVNDPKVIQDWTAAKLAEEKAKKGLNLTLADYITFKEERQFKAPFDNDAAVKALESGNIITLRVSVDGETPLPELTQKLQADVKEQVEGIAGVVISEVSVVVTEVAQQENYAARKRVE